MPDCLSPPVARCGGSGLPACVADCLETLALPTCVASGEVGCLAHRWTFDEEAGDLVFDSAGTSNGALDTGTLRIEGLSGGAIHLPSHTSHLVTFEPSLPLSGDTAFTVSTWVRLALRETAVLHPLTVFTSGGMSLVVDGHNLEVAFGVAQAAPRPPSPSRWNHFAFVYSSGNGTLFVNGYAVTHSDRFGSSGSAPTSIGDAVTAFHGVVDDLRIYQGALSPEQVRSLAEGLCALP